MRPLLVLLALTACAPDEPKDSSADDTAATDCSTESYWEGGNEESPNMNPGEDCIACHRREGEGPSFTLAGTVMGAWGDVDDCNGVEGVTVRITGADGDETTLTTNRAGNFYTRDPIAMPYTVLLERDGESREMVGEQSDGACASCHTADGVEGAPGRIVAP